MAGILRDLMQSASNTAAGNVSGPVDLISMLLRYGGVPVPQNAVGGSQWMAEMGLTAPVQPGAAQLAGETFGLVAPIAATAKAPQIPHPTEGRENCLQCHDPTGQVKPAPASHKTFTIQQCSSCHKPKQ